ncbi:MAG: LemA family protein [Candidatus Micrarchaeia archaeon]|jgi:LemA protein
MDVFTILLVLAVLAIAILAHYYNSFVRMRNKMDNTWAQIDVQLKRRYDLIPNLVSVVKAVAKQEKTLFLSVARARTAFESAKGVSEKADADAMMDSAVKGLFAVAEAYPKMRSNESFLSLQNELAKTEGKIAFARQFYNDAVLEYNTFVESFPSNVVATLLRFSKRDYFQAEEAARPGIKVKL